MSRRCIIAGIIAILFVFGAGHASAKVKIGIPPFENKAQIDPSMSDSFVDMLITAFVKTRKFDVVERSSMKRIVQEQKLGAYGAVPASSAAKMGKLIGAKYMVIGIISEAGYKEDAGAKLFGLSLAKARAVFGVDIRLVDTTTGKIVRAETYRKQKTGMNMGGRGTSISMDTGDFAELAREVIKEVVRMVTYTIYPIKVIKASGNTAYLNYGCSALKKGTTLEVFRLGEALIDPDTGEKLGSEEELVAKLKVTKCTHKFSVASVIDNKATGQLGGITAGMIARPYHTAPTISAEYAQEEISD